MNDTDSIDKKVAYSDLPETLLYKKTYFVVSYSILYRANYPGYYIIIIY